MLILVTKVGIFTFTDYQQFRACKADLTDVYVDVRGTRRRINAGWQCPECYGVRIALRDRQPHELQGFLCEECGCHWSEAVNA
jgi:hypothetical protein